MGVNIPLGFGQWSLPFRLTGDAEEMIITCGITDDAITPPNSIADTVTNALLATATFAASSWFTGYSFGPGRVTLQRSLGPIEGVGSVTRVGTNAGIAPLPQNCAGLIQKRTPRGGRQGRGRMYLPIGFSGEGNITAAGVWTQGLVDAVTNDFEAWRTALVATAFDLVLLHGDPLVGTAPAPDLITSLQCQSVIATQRTRLRR